MPAAKTIALKTSCGVGGEVGAGEGVVEGDRVGIDDDGVVEPARLVTETPDAALVAAPGHDSEAVDMTMLLVLAVSAAMSFHVRFPDDLDKTKPEEIQRQNAHVVIYTDLKEQLLHS